MNSNIKNAIIFLTGAVVGVIGSKFVFDRIYEERYNKEIESVKTIYQKEADHISKLHDERVKNLVEVIEMTEDEVNQYRAILEANGYEIYTSDDVRNGKVPKFKTKYDEVIESEHPVDDAEEEEITETIMDIARPSNNVAPYEINFEDFETGAPDYDKLSIEYYSYDQTLVDEVGNILNIDETVGRPAIDKLEHGKEDVIFVRNEWLQIDYEISLRDMAFDQNCNRD